VARRWRIGDHYQIHVYECSREDGQPSDDDRPVATFHTARDARRAVQAVNALVDYAELEGLDG
jgi:hypothetical protein